MMHRNEAWTLGREGMPPLHQAAGQGDLQEVQQLIQEDLALLHATGKPGWRSIFFAIEEGHLAVVSYLLDKGAPLDQRVQWR